MSSIGREPSEYAKTFFQEAPSMQRILSLIVLLLATPLLDAGGRPNTLTPKELADGWLLLFDGSSTFG